VDTETYFRTAGDAQTELKLAVALPRLELTLESHAPAVCEALGLVDAEEDAGFVDVALEERLVLRFERVVVLVGVECRIPTTLAVHLELKVKRRQTKVC
jgi:hypothetical protein